MIDFDFGCRPIPATSELRRPDVTPETIGGFYAGPKVLRPASKTPWWVRRARATEAEAMS